MAEGKVMRRKSLRLFTTVELRKSSQEILATGLKGFKIRNCLRELSIWRRYWP